MDSRCDVILSSWGTLVERGMIVVDLCEWTEPPLHGEIDGLYWSTVYTHFIDDGI